MSLSEDEPSDDNINDDSMTNDTNDDISTKKSNYLVHMFN